MGSDNQKVYCETCNLRILLLLVVFNVLRFVMKFPLRDCANVPSLPLLDLQSLGFCQKRLHASHPSSWILNKLKTSITSHSQDLHFSSYCLDPHRIPTSRTLTTTEATRSQSTRGNRCSRTLQGTFPFPSRTSWTAATWPVWRTTSKAWSHPGLVDKSLILWDHWRWDVFPDNFSFFGIFHASAVALTYQIRPLTNPRTVLRSKHVTIVQQVKHSLKSIRGLVVLLQWFYHTSMFITGTNTNKIE